MAASTWSWIGGDAAATIASDWTLIAGPGNANGYPAGGDTGIDTAGTIDLPFDDTLAGNLLELGGTGGAVAAFSTAGDGSIATGAGPVTFTNPTFDSNTVLTSAVPGQSTAETSVLNAAGTFVNQGTILADGPPGSTFTIDASATSFGGTTAPGYFYNPSVIQADAGNALTIDIGAGSEFFNDGEIIADGGMVKVTASSSAEAGGFGAVRGFDLIEGGGTFETADFEPASDANNGTHQEYEFADGTAGNTLKIDNIGSFSGVIIGFQAGDTVDLGTVLAVATLAYSTATNFLNLEAANGTTLASLVGTFGTGLATGAFPLTGGVADGITVGAGADGDTILTTTDTLEATSGASGAWQSTAVWAGGIVPGTTDTVSIGYGATAPFALNTGSSPVTVGGMGVYSPFATVQITSDTTLTTGQISDYAGTVDIAAGTTLTGTAIQLYQPSSSVTIAAGATAELSGHPIQALAAQNGQWVLQPGGNPFAFSVSAGTAVVDGAVLAGPAVGARGGSTGIGYEGNAASSAIIVNPGATVTDTHTTMGSDPTSSGTLTIDDATWTDVIDPQDTSSSRGNMNVGYDDVALNTPAGTPPPQEVGPAVLTIENNSTVTEGSGAQIADTPDSAGEVTVETGALWNIGAPGTGDGLGIGYGVNASGTLSVLNGGTVAIYGGGTFLSNGTTFISAGGIGVGKSAGATGTIIVSGAGSELSSVDGIGIGQSGQALVSILNGGTVSIEGNGIGVGQTFATGSSGTVDVGGSGAPAALDFLPAATGMTIGQVTRGTLNVSDNGTINLNGTGYLTAGSTLGATGTVVVGGTTAAAVINIGTDGLTDGFMGAGFVTVNSLGTINLTGTGYLTIGQSSAAVGSLVVGGGAAAAVIDVTKAGLTDGLSGTGNILVGNLGTISLTGTGSVAIGSNSGGSGGMTVDGGTVLGGASAFFQVGNNTGATGSVLVENDGLLSIVDGMNVGNSGTGSLTVNGGGTFNDAGGLTLGQNGGANGSATIQGSGSALNFTGGQALTVGNGGNGTLTINGATLTQDAASGGAIVGGNNGSTGSILIENAGTMSLAGNSLSVGINGGSNGGVTIQGAGSSLLTTGTAGVTVGRNSGGSGTLDITGGGSLGITGSGGVILGQNTGAAGQATVSGGVVTVGAASGYLIAGQSGGGTLTVDNGGSFNAGGQLEIGEFQSGAGSVLVSGATLSTAVLEAGVSGSGALTIAGGGGVTLTTNETSAIGTSAGSHGTVTVTGAGSMLQGQYLLAGQAGNAALNVQNGGAVSLTALDLGGNNSPTGGAASVAVTGGGEIQTGTLYVWQNSTISVDASGGSGVDVGTSGDFVTGEIDVENGRSIVGNGLIAAAVLNDGIIAASNADAPTVFTQGTLEIRGSITGSGVLQTGSGILRLDQAVPASQSIQFGTGSELILQTPGAVLTNPVTGLSDGDRIDLNLGAGVSITSASVTGPGTVTVFTNTGSYQLTNVSFAAGSGTSFFWGTDLSTGFDDITVQTPVVNWTGNAGDTVFGDGGNWQGGVAPNATDEVNFVNNPGTVTGTGSVLEMNVGPGNQANSGTWSFTGIHLTIGGQPNAPFPPFGIAFNANTVLNGGTISAAGGGDNIGNLDGVTVTAEGGAQVTVEDDNIGTNTGQSGSLVLTGPGTTWDEAAGPSINGYGVGYMSLGYNAPANGQAGGAGFLTVTDDAALNTGESANIGLSPGTFGSATVSAGGVWTVSQSLQDGQSGTGTLAVSGGTVNVAGYVGVGQNTGGAGSVFVSNAGIFNAGTAMTLGFQGSGTLNVSGGSVATTGSLVLGGSLGGFGFVSLANGGITAPSGVQIGGSGNGLMTVTTGGLLKFGGTYNPVGGGPATDATLVIVNGGTAEATQAPGSVAVMQIANSGTTSSLDGSNGTVVVAGIGSLLNLDGNGITVGDGGDGGLEVLSGATVDAGVLNSGAGSALVAGLTAGSDGQINVSGAASGDDATLNLGGYVALGQGGSANLTVGTGGFVNITNAATNGTGLGIGVDNAGNAANVGGQGEVDVTGGGTLSDQGTIVVGGYGANGILNVTGGGAVSTAIGLTVGDAANIGGTVYGGSGSVNIGAGSTLLITQPSQLAFTVQIGSENASAGGQTAVYNGSVTPTGLAEGSVTVSGAGALLNTNNNPVAIGLLADGNLTVSQGGSVAAGTANSVTYSAIGIGRQGVGSLVVTDPGSSVTASGLVYVGREGSGNLVVENHATLAAGLDLTGAGGIIVGNGANPSQTGALTGGTGDAQVTAGGDLRTAASLVVGEYDSNGALSVSNGGTVEASDQVMIGLSETILAGGSIVTNAGTTIVSAATLLAGQGVITVGAGGLLKADAANIPSPGIPAILVGDGPGAAATLNVTGAAATVTTGGYAIDVGSSGGGTVLIDQGGTVVAGTPFAADQAIRVGTSAGATGALTVADPGSSLTADGQMSVGLSGQGTLLVQNQATVTTGANAVDTGEGFEAGQNAGADGGATVTGTKSLLTNTGRFIVGDAGFGSLIISDGGTVSTTPGSVAGLAGLVIANTAGAAGSSVNASGAGSQLGVTGLLEVGAGGSGALSLGGGAAATAGTFDTGVSAGSVGQVGLSGAGTSLTVAGSATVADVGTGVLSVLSGATFAASGLTIGANKGSSGAVIVSGTGSDLAISGVLNIGSALGAGDLTVGPSAAVHASVINLEGQVVLEGGLLDPSVTVINPNKSLGGSGTVASGDIIDEGILQAGDGTPGQLELVQGIIVGGGTLTENGSKVANKANAVGVLQINTFGTMEVDGAVLNAATTTFANDVTPATTYTVTHSVIDVNFEDSTGVLQLDDIAGFGGTIATFQAGDQFIITGGTLSGLGVNNGTTLTMADSGNGGTDQIIFNSQVSASYFNIVNGNSVDVVACFAAGTLIGTEAGPVAVESLHVGDRVVTNDGGLEQIEWIGSRTVNCRAHPAPETVWPVRISAGAFGRNVPVRDLYLSPDHAVFVNGALVPVKYLINGTSIATAICDRVVYYHVELPHHAVILAEGLTVESYLDLGDRANFGDGDTIRLFPDFAARLSPDAALAWETKGAAPLVMAGERLELARRGVMECASSCGSGSLEANSRIT